MLKLKLIFVLIAFWGVQIYAQVKIFGEVTFLSSQYAYIKFNSTETLNPGDTLFSGFSNIPAAIVKFKSSTSVACQRLKSLNIGDTLFFYTEIRNQKEEIQKASIIVSDTNSIEPRIEVIDLKKQVPNKKTYNLRMSFQSYGDLNDFNNTNRYRYSFNFQKEEFLLTGLNFETYFIINYNKNKYTAKNDIKELLKIYSLNFDYQISENHNLIFGRSLNPYIYAIGSLDGIQYFYKTGANTFGVILGSRPDYTNYWFEPKLFQAGVFLNRIDSIKSKSIDNTIGFVEQTNKFKADRRYIYFQHRNNLIPLTNFFFSSEADFFFVNKGKITKKVNLSSLYSMLTIRPHRILSINLSYDSRRNVYYIESFKNTIDSLIENELRQGFRISALIRPFSILFINLQYSRREIRNDMRPTSNIGTTIGFNNLPIINTSISFNYYKYLTSFIEGNNYSIYISKNLFGDLLLTGNFRLYQFRQIQSHLMLLDRFAEIGLYMNLFKNLSISINFEKKINREKSSYLMIDFTNRF